jgi:outer membrane protein assembly factor BamB
LGGAVLYSPTLTEEGVLYISSLKRNLVALSTKDGSVLWERNFDSDLWTQPALADGKLFFGDIAGKVYALSAEDGADIWSQALNEPVIGRPTEIENGVVFPTENGSLFALSFNGERLWSRTFEGKIYTGPTAIGDQLAVGIAQGKDYLKLINASTGQDVWTFVAPK